MRKRMMIIGLLLCLVVAAGIFSWTTDPHDNRILEGVSVGGLDLSGQTLAEAWRTIKDAADAGPAVTAVLPEETLSLPDARVNALSVLWSAYGAGRVTQERSTGLLPHLRLDEAAIRRALAAYAEACDTHLTPGHYVLAGPAPDLEIESSSRPTQTLELTLGLPTARIDQEDAFQRILAAYDMAFSGRNTLSGFKVDVLEEPALPDLAGIYDEVFTPPVDDSLDMENFTVIPGAWGHHFDLDAAQKQVAAAAWGETLSIPMIFQEPEIYGDEVYFRDLLGYCETKHTDDENRNNNLRKACESMDGLILQPGEVFSYNDTLGPRTRDNGYLRAGAYSGWELVQAYGGGICQGSTTIYGAALHADLEIVQRKNHGYKVGYAEPGLDATVNWGGPDFQFRNSTHFPIKIAAEVADGFVKVSILGTEERDYYIGMESEASYGESTIYAKSYKCRYDRETGELLSRELETRSNYMR